MSDEDEAKENKEISIHVDIEEDEEGEEGKVDGEAQEAPMI